MSYSPVLGVVLAGGASRRMGAAKPGIEFAGGRLIDRPLATLAAAGLEVVVIAKPDSELPDLLVPLWDEPATPRHPLCGIVAALERRGGPIVVLACDMPFVPPELIARLAATDSDALLPVVGGRAEPLVARYGPSALDSLRDALDRELSMSATIAALGADLIDEQELRRYGDPETILANANTPAELEAIRRRAGD